MRNAIIINLGYIDDYYEYDFGGVVDHLINRNGSMNVFVYTDFKTDSFLVKVYHEELPDIDKGLEYTVYSYVSARAMFPYLFVNTNPILWRKYNLYIWKSDPNISNILHEYFSWSFIKGVKFYNE